MLTEMPDRVKPYIPAGARRGGQEPFPRDVEMILSAMEAGREARIRAAEAQRGQGGMDLVWEDQRIAQRITHHTRAELRLFSDPPGASACLLYVRDADPRGIGFITQQRLPLGYGGYVELIAPNGRPVSVHCTLSRCREAVPGWYEGALNFNLEQVDFKCE